MVLTNVEDCVIFPNRPGSGKLLTMQLLVATIVQ